MTDKQIIISDYFTATLTLPEKIVEYQLKPCRDNQLVDKINEQNSYLERKEQECETLASQLDFEVQKKECLEQECERLNNIINVAKNSKLDLKSFLVGEAVQNEYEEQLDQLKAENEELKEQFKLAEPLYQACNIKDKKIDKLKQQLEAYKMEADEGKEINAELKATNEDLLSIQYKLADNNKQLRQTLTEIKEILIKTPTDSREHFLNAKSVILQICDEVEKCIK